MNNVLDGVLKGPERLSGRLAEPAQPTPYELLPAKSDRLGGVMVPDNSKIKVDGDGNIDIDSTKLTKADVGLENVDNTSDLNKPISINTQEVLNQKANIDGAYEGLTAGNAEQLISSITEDDKTPYLFRTTGGHVDVGNRKNMSIVGGTICWNQEITDGGFQDSTKWKAQERGATLSINSGIATVKLNTNATPSLSNPALAENQATTTRAQVISGHTYLLVFDSCIISDAESAPSLGFCIFLRTNNLSWNMTLRTVRNLTTVSDANLQWQHHALVVTASGTGAAFSYFGISQAVNYLSANEGLKIKNFNIFDISTMLPQIYFAINLSTRNANTGIVENSTNASTFINLFIPKIPYAKSSNQLVSVKTTKHITTGFNQWDEEWVAGYLSSTGIITSASGYLCAKNLIRIVPNTNYHLTYQHRTGLNLRFFAYYDEQGTFLNRVTASQNFTTPANARYMRFDTNSGYGSDYLHDICLNIRWDGERDGDYEEYVTHEYSLEDIELRGVPHVDNNGNVYYDGDVYKHDGTVTRWYKTVDMGELTWNTFSSNPNVFYAHLYDGELGMNSDGLCPDYPFVSLPPLSLNDGQGVFGAPYVHANHGSIAIRDDSYGGDEAAFKAAMSGKILVYKMLTSITDSALSYADPMVVDDWGTEEFVDTRAVPVPVGNESKYQANLRAKLEMAPDSPNDGDGDYIVRHSSNRNQYIKLPSLPTANGTYKFTCTVSGGIPTLAWVEEV